MASCGHGFTRVPSYAEQAQVGKVDGFAVPRITGTGAARRIDAGTGFAYPAIELALEALVPLTREMGVASVGIFASHHCGQAGRHVERLADAGLIGFAYANTPSAMAFHGGTRSRLGTDPMAFAAPVAGRAPLVIDMALSVVARSKIVAAKAKGDSIPAGWAVDFDGQPTTDANAALAGTLLPVGGAKGSALALMVEILCGALAGSQFGWEASGFMDAKGGPPRSGQFLIALDPAHFAGDSFGRAHDRTGGRDRFGRRASAGRPAAAATRTRCPDGLRHRRRSSRTDRVPGGRGLRPSDVGLGVSQLAQPVQIEWLVQDLDLVRRLDRSGGGSSA